MNTTPELPNSELPNSPASDSALAPSEGRLPQSAPSPRRLFGVAVFAAILGFGVTLSFGYATMTRSRMGFVLPSPPHRR
jgi:hypothetical protein